MTDVSRSLSANPLLSTWVRVEPDGTVCISSGKVEIGQHIGHALALLAADELGVHPDQVRMEPVSTEHSPDEGYTAGSMSIEQSGQAIRLVCAEVRAALVDAAAEVLDADPADLVVADGTIATTDGTRRVTMAQLAAAVPLDRSARADVTPIGPDARRLVGTATTHSGLRTLVDGTATMLHDMVFPGMLHGRVVRPPGRHAELRHAGSAPSASDVVVDGRFLGVIATTELLAERAAAELTASSSWDGGTPLPPLGTPTDVARFLRSGPVVSRPVTGDGAGVASDVATTRRATYSRPFLAHASIGTSVAIARWSRHRLEVWSHTQGVFPLRTALATAFGMAADDVVVRHVPGSGCYGHNGADDVAFDAALLARARPGEFVRVQWTRADELAWAPFGSAMVVEIEAALDHDDRITGWRQDIWSCTHVARPGYAGPGALLGATHRADATARPDAPDPGGMVRNAVPGYEIGPATVVGHCRLDSPVRTSSLRSLGAHGNVFAIECFMDELAEAAGIDPLEFRLRHLADERGRAVLEQVAERARWHDRRRAGDHTGRGLGYARYKGDSGWCAVVADVEAEHTLRVVRLTVCVDVGMVVDPVGVANQVEGGAVQATSWTLLEQVGFGTDGVTSTTWDTYPILRFSQVPHVDVSIIDRPGEPPAGAGELAQGPVTAAIANAVADALGLRVRDLPLTDDRLRLAAAR